MLERDRCQGEMARRVSGTLPFIDKRMVEQVAAAICAEVGRVKNGSGEILYPYPISPREESEIRGRLKRPLRERVFFVPGIRMKEGVGTLIQIDARGKIYGKRC